MKVGEIDVPEPDEDPALLAALYSGFAMYEVWRKIVLAACKEMIRASASLTNQKITESRLDDLSRVHACYLQFLETHLRGRIQWEREVQKNGFGR
jgi:hypothetical protein